MTDEVIEELYKHREELAKRFNYDVRKMLEHFQDGQIKNGREIVSFVKKNGKAARVEIDKKAA